MSSSSPAVDVSVGSIGRQIEADPGVCGEPVEELDQEIVGPDFGFVKVVLDGVSGVGLGDSENEPSATGRLY